MEGGHKIGHSDLRTASAAMRALAKEPTPEHSAQRASLPCKDAEKGASETLWVSSGGPNRFLDASWRGENPTLDVRGPGLLTRAANPITWLPPREARVRWRRVGVPLFDRPPKGPDCTQKNFSGEFLFPLAVFFYLGDSRVVEHEEAGDRDSESLRDSFQGLK